MNSLKKSIVLACAASVLSFGVAMAQTDPAAPATPATPDATPAAGDTMAKPMASKPMMKKHMMKKHKKMIKKM